MASPTSSNGAEVPSVVPSIPMAKEPAKTVDDQSIGEIVRDATSHVSTLLRAEVELAKAEVTKEVKKGVQGSVFFIVALVIMLFSLFFFFFAIAELLAIWLNRAAAFGIVFGVMILAAGLFAFLGYLRVKKIRAPEKTITSLKETGQAFSQVGRSSSAPELN